MFSIHQTEYLRYNATTNTIYREDTTEQISEVTHEHTSITIISWKKTVEKNNMVKCLLFTINIFQLIGQMRDKGVPEAAIKEYLVRVLCKKEMIRSPVWYIYCI